MAAPAARLSPHNAVAYGFRDPLPQVGKIFRLAPGGLSPEGHCTGTLVTSGYIITAGHCLYQNDVTAAGDKSSYTGFLQSEETLYFVPDESPSGAGGSDWADASQPYGAFKIVQSYVPPSWQAHADGGADDGGYDYGLAVLEPDSQGVYPGQRSGAYPVMWNYSPAVGAETYMMGYPEDGVFGQPQQYYGDEPYYCTDTFDGDYRTSANDSIDASLIGSGYYHQSTGCPMTGGASGGPDFVQAASGQWYINGVNNIATPNGSTGYSGQMSFNWWGSAFGAFFCYVLPNQCS